jgi:hypothetical protein
MPVITRSGRDLHAASPASLPWLDDSIPPLVRAMIAALIRHQDTIASSATRSVVLQVRGEKIDLKVTRDLAV